MSTDYTRRDDGDEEADDITLGNGDTLAERADAVDVGEDETCSTDEMRDRLDL